MTTSTDDQPNRDIALGPSVLRAVRSAAGYAQRARALEVLRAELFAAEGRDGRTSDGRHAAGLGRALELLEHLDPEPGEQWSQIVGYDSAEIWYYDPPDEDPDEMPVRVVVSDSDQLLSAAAWLTLAEAEQFFREGMALVEKLRTGRVKSDG